MSAPGEQLPPARSREAGTGTAGERIFFDIPSRAPEFSPYQFLCPVAEFPPRQVLENAFSLALAAHLDSVFRADHHHIVAAEVRAATRCGSSPRYERSPSAGHSGTTAFRPLRGDARRPARGRLLADAAGVRPRCLHLGSRRCAPATKPKPPSRRCSRDGRGAAESSLASSVGWGYCDSTGPRRRLTGPSTCPAFVVPSGPARHHSRCSTSQAATASVSASVLSAKIWPSRLGDPGLGSSRYLMLGTSDPSA